MEYLRLDEYEEYMYSPAMLEAMTIPADIVFKYDEQDKNYVGKESLLKARPHAEKDIVLRVDYLWTVKPKECLKRVIIFHMKEY